MGVTAIKRVENTTDQLVRVYNLEKPGDQGSGADVESGHGIDANMWIPWCTASRDFAEHHVSVEVGGSSRFWIWQAARGDGDYVRVNTTPEWADPGSQTLGNPEVNGDRVLLVNDASVELYSRPATISWFPEDLLGRHHGWHHGGHGGWPGRNIPMGQTGSGIEFLTFHQDFVRDFRSWYATRPGGEIVPWTRLPAALKDDVFEWASWASDYQRLMSNDPPFSSADALGIFIENGIHNNFLHGAMGAYYGESVLNDPATSPLSAFFYKLHSLVDHWWRLWTMKTAPFGSLDIASAIPGGIRVAGWAIDPDSVAPIDVHVYLDGAFAKGVRADLSRPDVAVAHPSFGDLHGFDITLSAGAGSHEVCAYAINTGPGSSNPMLGCSLVFIKGKEKDKEKDKEKEKEKDTKEDDKVRKESDKLRKEIDDLAEFERLALRLNTIDRRLGSLEVAVGEGRPFIRPEERPDVQRSSAPADGRPDSEQPQNSKE